jgi:hypothetical protein
MQRGGALSRVTDGQADVDAGLGQKPDLARHGRCWREADLRKLSASVCQSGRLCVPPRVADRTLTGVDRGAGCRSARTTGLWCRLEEAFALGGTERKP